MYDRESLYPGRIELSAVPGQPDTYDMTRADEPTEIGTPLNKNSLLKDSTAALYGLGIDAVPDDVLNAIPRLIFKPWAKIAEYKSHGAVEFNVPSGITVLAAVIGGAGGSGPLRSDDGHRDELTNFQTSGGASGYIEVIRPFNVSGGQKIQGVVGEGGKSESAKSTTAANGNNGGSTSFNGIIAIGGEGGKFEISRSGYSPDSSIGFVDGIEGDGQKSSPTDVRVWDPYGNTYYQIVSGAGSGITMGSSGGIRGSVFKGVTGKDGSSPDSVLITRNSPGSVPASTGLCSGGSSMIRAVQRNTELTTTVSSGAGSDGFIFVYALRSEAVAAGVSIIE